MVCLHLLFLYSKLLIAHYIWIQKETPTSKFKENSQSQNTWVYLGALPAQVGGKELIWMVINCILSSTKMIIWVLLAFCGTVRAFPGTASFLGIRLWALGILCDFTASFTWLSGGLCSHRAVTQGRVGRCWQWPQLPGKGRRRLGSCAVLWTLCVSWITVQSLNQTHSEATAGELEAENVGAVGFELHWWENGHWIKTLF